MFGNRYRDLVAESGGPGCAVICGRRGGVFRKCVWVVVVSVLTTLTFRDCISVFKEYGEFPVIINYKYQQELSPSFPDVTICNANPLRRSRLCGDEVPRNSGIPADVLKRNCADPPLYLDPNAEDLDLRDKLRLWVAQMKKDELRTVQKLAHQLDDVVVGCEYGRKNCNGHRYFAPTFDSRFGNCFCFHCKVAGGVTEDFFHYQSTSRTEDGLVVMLDPQLDEYLPTSTEAGFIVMVHGRGFQPDICNDAVFVEPGYSTYIGLRLDCMSFCHQDLVRHRCGCESRDFPITTNAKGKTYPICEEPGPHCGRPSGPGSVRGHRSGRRKEAVPLAEGPAKWHEAAAAPVHAVSPVLAGPAEHDRLHAHPGDPGPEAGHGRDPGEATPRRVPPADPLPHPGRRGRRLPRRGPLLSRTIRETVPQQHRLRGSRSQQALSADCCVTRDIDASWTYRCPSSRPQLRGQKTNRASSNGPVFSQVDAPRKLEAIGT
ncbi:conserved hypothetical protein [Ixodes scapularis]|uniref:Uncharacterized protein n=1 Tax=Ixodes scapularis TaxID=6945 RepID=B7QEV7_IXOSC|nr:conserved hypothetical protein [Ixodes scapularis]|eukprot:XP_002414071.1 conserved hypothetical protein [Ixodes scapularis]